MENADWLNQLKLRGVFGKTGNGIDNSGCYMYWQTFSHIGTAGYPLGTEMSAIGNANNGKYSISKSFLDVGKSV